MNMEVARQQDMAPAETPETTTGRRVYRPLADIVETEDGVSLMLDMPGVSGDDVDITLEKRELTIRGKVNPTELEKLQPVYAEYEEGDYERTFILGEDFDPDKIEASLENGVLTVTLPRAAQAKPKKIKVKSA